MAKPNHERWRMTVDLGQELHELLLVMIHTGKLREHLGHARVVSPSRAIRLAVLFLARQKLGPDDTGHIDPFDL